LSAGSANSIQTPAEVARAAQAVGLVQLRTSREPILRGRHAGEAKSFEAERGACAAVVVVRTNAREHLRKLLFNLVQGLRDLKAIFAHNSCEDRWTRGGDKKNRCEQCNVLSTETRKEK
jgi:hypothetical protein